MKISNLSRLVSTLLAISAIDLGLMVPGGFVETRDFSAYSPLVLATFNVFLTVLGLGSLIFTYMIIRGSRRYVVAAYAGLAYVAVYLLDLWRVFPVTPNLMSPLLATLEWIGTGVGAALAATAILATYRVDQCDSAEARPKNLAPSVLIALALVALLIVAFATRSAMGIR